MWYGYLADLVVAIHVGYIAYVLGRQALICLAAPLRWQWARNPWFRFTHLAAIGVVVYEAIWSRWAADRHPCPGALAGAPGPDGPPAAEKARDRIIVTWSP